MTRDQALQECGMTLETIKRLLERPRIARELQHSRVICDGHEMTHVQMINWTIALLKGLETGI